MKSLFIFCLFVFETLVLASLDAGPIFLGSSLYSLVPEHGTVTTPIRTTEDVANRTNHINRKTDQSSAKATAYPIMTPSLPIERKNSTKSESLIATDKKNSTGPTLEPTTESIVVRHIRREKRAYEVTMPFNFQTLHTACEFDLPMHHVVHQLPHCRWLYNVRFQSREYFRSYMLAKGEAFFFGQYHERLRRYEQMETKFEFT